ncbi:hypothetical protein TNCT_455191 [Trichonephila clavata]|uniref:Uncharacterized protein n=1 Tax=Trichonephila clavata TaxID=2740835 RepID=A0A8X6FPI4_TRICU|nr:hypothetical protein TNCT_455191 [Trichonephila clavata]
MHSCSKVCRCKSSHFGGSRVGVWQFRSISAQVHSSRRGGVWFKDSEPGKVTPKRTVGALLKRPDCRGNRSLQDISRWRVNTVNFKVVFKIPCEQSCLCRGSVILGVSFEASCPGNSQMGDPSPPAFRRVAVRSQQRVKKKLYQKERNIHEGSFRQNFGMLLINFTGGEYRPPPLTEELSCTNWFGEEYFSNLLCSSPNLYKERFAIT